MLRPSGVALVAFASTLFLSACSSDASLPPTEAASRPARCVPGDCGGCDGCLATCLCATGDVAACVPTCENGAVAGAAGWGAAGTTGNGAGGASGASGGGAAGSSGSGGAAGGGGAGTGGTAGVGGSGGVAVGSLPSDDCYTEPVFPDASIDDVVATYGGSDWKDELIAAVRRRWPAGAWLLHAQRGDSYFGQFSDSSSWTGMVGMLDTLVHEETHLFNAYHAQAMNESHALFVRDDLIFHLPADQGFARAEIYDELEPATKGNYASTYLTGSSGQRGFNALLDELTCYSNELPAVGLVGEYFPGYGVSLRDGTVAFLYYLQRYLERARTHHAAFYEQARHDPVYRDVVKVSWLRAHFFLQYADRFPKLGIDDAKYRSAMYRPENLDEISRFVGQTVGASHCVM